MVERIQVESIVMEMIDVMNKNLEDSGKIGKAMGTVLFGEDGCLDSLGLVNFISGIEERIEEKLGCEVLLADENSLALEQSPFQTVNTIIEHICALLEN